MRSKQDVDGRDKPGHDDCLAAPDDGCYQPPDLM
jgi:hypothetical protein